MFKPRYMIGFALLVAVAGTTVLYLRDTTIDAAIFEDATAQSGINYTGVTHGAAWGDIDGDGLPDLYVTNHLNNATLYRNLGKGRFVDVTDTYLSPDDIGGDKHGAVWADVDKDGRLDLVQLTGALRGVGAEPKRLWMNRGSHFEDVAAAVGIDNPLGRTRMPLWFDFDHDGRLDLFQGAERRFDDVTPPFVFMRHDDKFTPSQEALKFAERTVPFCIVTALNDDNKPSLICRVSGQRLTARVFDTNGFPARELEPLPQTGFDDIAAADFDNDGRIDLFLARKNPMGPLAFTQPSAKEVVADLWSDHTNVDKPLGFGFRTNGQPSFHIVSEQPTDPLTLDRVYIGKQGMSPNDFTFTPAPDTAEGMKPNEVGKQSGIYLGMIGPDQWELRVTAPRESLKDDKAKYQQIAIKVNSSEAITDLRAVGDEPANENAPARLFMNRDGKLVEESDQRGVNKRVVAGVNVVAGDFNNDMYQDIFVVASGDIGKQENLLLLNRGDGRFDVVRDAGGAAGDRVGVGDSVTTADYDGDGFLDLLVSTGGSMGRSLGLPSENGGYHLYRNAGNGNHWIEIDLEGTRSNRDGIGAVVRLETGGVRQVRVQDGGVHERGQNHARLHFGLAKNTRIDKLVVHWPSGAVQELKEIAADQVLRIKEPAG